MKKMLPLMVILALVLTGCTAPEDRQNSPAAQATRAAVQVVDYQPENLAALQSATLTWTQPEDREIVHVAALTEKDSLTELEGLLRSAQKSQEGAPEGCFSQDYHHELTLICADGSVIRMDVAVDECCTLKTGGSYYTFQTGDGLKNHRLYALFGAAPL